MNIGATPSISRSGLLPAAVAWLKLVARGYLFYSRRRIIILIGSGRSCGSGTVAIDEWANTTEASQPDIPILITNVHHIKMSGCARSFDLRPMLSRANRVDPT